MRLEKKKKKKEKKRKNAHLGLGFDGNVNRDSEKKEVMGNKYEK